MMVPKTKPLRSKKHLRRVKTLPCMITGASGVDAHHLMRAEQRGIGRKCGDNWAVPLSFEMHRDLHNFEGGEINFFEHHGHPYESVKAYATELWEETNGN